MPYLNEGRKKEVGSEMKRAKTDGDYNFLYSRAYLKVFIAKPSYATIAEIGKAVCEPHKIRSVEDLDDYLTVQGVSSLDRCVARQLAYLEFYRRIGAKYEDQCIVKNGDLEEYKQAERIIQEKFATAEAK